MQQQGPADGPHPQKPQRTRGQGREGLLRRHRGRCELAAGGGRHHRGRQPGGVQVAHPLPPGQALPHQALRSVLTYVWIIYV